MLSVDVDEPMNSFLLLKFLDKKFLDRCITQFMKSMGVDDDITFLLFHSISIIGDKVESKYNRDVFKICLIYRQ